MTVQLPLAARVLFWIFATCIPLSIVVGILLTAVYGKGRQAKTSVRATSQPTGTAARGRQTDASSVSVAHLRPTGPHITVRQRATPTTDEFATYTDQFWHPPISDTLH